MRLYKYCSQRQLSRSPALGLALPSATLWPSWHLSCRKGHRDLVGSELRARQPCALMARKASQWLGTASGSGQGILLFHCSGTAVPTLQCSRARRRSRKCKVLSGRPLRCWRICFVRRWERRHCRELVAGAVEEPDSGSPGHSNSAGDSGHKCQWRKVPLDVRTQLFTGSEVKRWDRLLREGPHLWRFLKLVWTRPKATQPNLEAALPWGVV